MFLITSVICKNADTQICELTHVSADVKFIIINFFYLILPRKLIIIVTHIMFYLGMITFASLDFFFCVSLLDMSSHVAIMLTCVECLIMQVAHLIIVSANNSVFKVHCVN